MPPSNTDTVRRLFEAVEAGDLDGILGCGCTSTLQLLLVLPALDRRLGLEAPEELIADLEQALKP